MPIAPHIAPETIYMGAAHICLNADEADKDDWRYIWVDGDITVELVRSELDVQTSGFGQVVSPSTDETVQVTFTPANRVDSTILSWLYGTLFSAKPGSSWFGSTNTPLWIHTLDGRIMKIANCKPTEFPGLNFGVGVKRWNGSVTCTGVISHDTPRTTANALFTPWANEAFDASPDESEFPQVPCQVTWAPLGGGVLLEAMGAWTVTPTAALSPRTLANLGTIDYGVSNVSIEVTASPANITEAQLWGQYAIGSSRVLGTNVAGGQMVLTEDSPGITCTIPNAIWVQRPTRYSVENPIAGDCVWRARRTHNGTGWSPLATIAMTA